MKIFTFPNPFQEKSHYDPDDMAGESTAQAVLPKLRTLSQTSTSMKDGSDFRITGEFKNPQEIIKRSCDFESVIVVLQQLKYDEKFQPESHVSEKQQIKIVQRDEEVKEMLEKLSQMTEESAQNYLAQECCNLLQDIGPPWNWLHNFASQTCREKSYNFLESVRSDTTPLEPTSSEESFDYLNEKFISEKESAVTTATNEDVKSSVSGVSGASGISFSLYNADNSDDTASNNHKLLIDTICSISEASDKGGCNIRDTTSIASFLEGQHSKQQLEAQDYERLKKFINLAQERAIVFNDLNELYNYFIHESSRERFSAHGIEIREEVEDEEETENVVTSTDKTCPETVEKCEKAESKNVVSIFGESGIEVDGKLLDAKVSERMILGLVDRPQFEDNVSEVASSISSLSQAETVKEKQNVTRETDTQTVSYKEQIHSKRIQGKHAGKSKSASSIKRQPFTCKIPKLPGIGPSIDGERLEKLLRFIAHRSFQQGGLVYPRNFLEDECPSMM